jgi:hypothetical protein
MAYTTLEEIRDDGVLEADFSDEVVEAAILLAQEYIDLICQQFFELTTQTRYFDGTMSKLLVLDVPLITLTSVEWNEFGTTYQTQNLVDFRLYNQFPDDRYYPRIAIADHASSYIRQARRLAYFPKGRRNIRITGAWGYVAADGISVPALINRVAKILTVLWMNSIGDGSLLAVLQQYGLKKETVEKHTVEFAASFAAGDYTGIPMIDNILKQYKRGSRMGHV